jgi:hypothetical protein
MEVAGGEGEPARKVQGTRAVLARGGMAAMELNHGDGVPA